MKYFLSVIIGSTFMFGCTPAAVHYAEATNPGCKVTKLESTGASTTVLIQCPGQEPKRETFTER